MATHIRYYQGEKHEFVARSQATPTDFFFIAEHLHHQSHPASPGQIQIHSLGRFYLFHPEFIGISLEEQEFLRIERVLRVRPARRSPARRREAVKLAEELDDGEEREDMMWDAKSGFVGRRTRRRVQGRGKDGRRGSGEK